MRKRCTKLSRRLLELRSNATWLRPLSLLGEGLLRFEAVPYIWKVLRRCSRGPKTWATRKIHFTVHLKLFYMHAGNFFCRLWCKITKCILRRRPSVGKVLVRDWFAMNFHSFSYIGQKTARGILCDVIIRPSVFSLPRLHIAWTRAHNRTGSVNCWCK